MTLTQDLDTIIDQCKVKPVAKRQELVKILQEVHFDQRLIEDSMDMEEILDEFVNQSLIWVDDESFRGDLTYLKKLILVLEDHDDVLEKYRNLTELLNHTRENISLCNGMKQDLIHVFNLLGWPTSRAFLESLGLSQSDLNNLENLENQARFEKGFEIFLTSIPQEITSDRELTQYVIDKLNQTCPRPAQKMAQKYL